MTTHVLRRRLSAPWMVLALSVLFGRTAVADDTTFVSDDFNSLNLKRPLWTLVDPQGDASVRMQYQNTDSASIVLSVPGGTIHDIAPSGYDAARIVQNAYNTDFRLEVKFFSGIQGGTLASYALQGIVVEQDDGTIMRFDFTTGTTSNMRVFAATYDNGLSNETIRVNSEIAANGTRPLFMQVDRVGDEWTQRYSFDGTTWTPAVTFTYPIVVAKVGVFAGNAGYRTETHSAVIDYFWNPDAINAPEDTVVALTDTIPPLVHSVRVSRLAPNAFEISWDTDEPATGILEYGRTESYGTSLSHGDLLTSHKLVVTDVLSNTTYNFRVSSTDAATNTEVSANYKVRTQSYVIDGVTRSDDFVGDALETGTWEFVNPVGDGSHAVGGGLLSLSVPAGTNHDIWTGGARAPRVMQSVGSSNLILAEAKFLTGITGTSSAFRLQGILFEQDSQNMVRVDFVNGPSGTKIFAAGFTDGFATPITHVNTNILSFGVAPLFLRAEARGAKWTVWYSLDGLSWTEAGVFWHFLNPAKVGVFAGNAGTSPPAFTSQVEYFAGALPATPALTDPANLSTGVVVSPTLTWSVTTGAEGYTVQVSADTFFTSFVINDSSLASPSKVATGLNYETKYFWRARAKNAKGAGFFSTAWSFTTESAAPNTPALVSPANGSTGVAIPVTLVWNKIPAATTYRVQVSTDPTFAGGIVVDAPAVTDTTRSVSGLAQGVVYYWRVNATSPGGTSPYSSPWSFGTVAALPGAVALVSPANLATVPADNVQLVWHAGQPVVTKYWLDYAVDAQFQFVISDSTITDTVKNLGSLIADVTYYWRVRAGNASGWGPYSEVWSFIAQPVGVKDRPEIPSNFVLAQNYPNPFNPATTIEFGLPQASDVRIELYNLLGERLLTIVEGVRSAGYHTVRFDAGQLSSGLYLYRLSAGTVSIVRKMMLVR